MTTAVLRLDTYETISTSLENTEFLEYTRGFLFERNSAGTSLRFIFIVSLIVFGLSAIFLQHQELQNLFTVIP